MTVLADIDLSQAEFLRIQARLHEMSGIWLGEAKRTLVMSRLAREVRRLKLRSFNDYVDHLESPTGSADQEAFINALTTNLTRFWREEHHFAHLLDHMPDMLESCRSAAGGRAPRLRIWSAGCSTGQEAYTIAMALLAAFPVLSTWNFRILATDIDTRAIEKAASGIYSESDLHGLAPDRLQMLEHLDNRLYRVPTPVRRVIVFKPLNLMGPWPMRGQFDAIFCRNVAIYFDRATQDTLFDRLGSVLSPHGYLYIGHSEKVTDSGRFRLTGKTIYQLNHQAARSAA